MSHTRLLTPGPVPVPDEVVAAMATSMLYHRSPPFQALLAQVLEDLRWVFQTRGDVFALTCSGTGGLESALVNTLARGDTILVVKGGKFGQRWEKLAHAYGVHVHPIELAWGESVEPAQVEEALNHHPHIRAVCVQACETSTGAVHPIQDIARLVSALPQTHLIVDAITGLGVFDIPMDDWGIDVLISGSQKAFMLPPGLALVGVSEKAWRANTRADLPRFYFDWRQEKKSLETSRTTSWTPAITLFMGLAEVLRQMKEEGLPAIFARHARVAEAIRAGIRALGLQLFPRVPSNSLTAALVPAGIDGKKLTTLIRERHHAIVGGGQDHMAGKIIRIGHMGAVDEVYAVTALSILGMALGELGHGAPPGAGVAAAVEFFAAHRQMEG